MSLDSSKLSLPRHAAVENFLNWCEKHKVGILPERWRTAKPSPKDIVDIAKPTLIGVPVLFIVYLIWGITGFATGLAIIVGFFILDATRPLRGGHWLGKPEEEPVIAPPSIEETEEAIKRRFLVEEGMDPDKWWGKRVQDALIAHNIKANVVVLDTSGATHDMYELEVQQGFDINVITTLGDNFARALKLPKGEHVTIDANVGNGRAALFVPKTEARPIRTLEMLQTEGQPNCTLPGLVGEDLRGNAILLDITQAPHLLIGGEIGMERAGQMLNLILSAAYNVSPETLRITLIDPKMLELSVCNTLPHVTEPVITDMHKAYKRLLHIKEMMNIRCKQFLDAGVNNIAAYNRRFPEHALPYQVVAFSELTVGLKCTVPISADDDREVGDAIKSLLLELVGAAPTQEAGIHFLFGIQCYDPKTCGETLRQGIPSSIGMRVRAHEFSELLIGQSGCETLDEHGECYVFMSGDATPKRALAALASDEEIEQAVQAIREKWTAHE